MDFNLKALGAETVMVDRRIVAQLAEAELLLRDGEKLPYQFIRQNSFIGVNPSERLFAKRAVTGKNKIPQRKLKIQNLSFLGKRM